jgi:opacity protein-like surface antigen
MKRILIALLASIITLTANATDANKNISDTDKNLIMAALKGWNVRLSAGYNLGGTAPLPLPVEIRGIEGFNPGLNLSLEGSAEKMFGKGDWGLRFGIELETKGMTTNADTKNYYMEVANGDGIVSGYWTGKVETKVKNTYLSIPVLAVYKINERWNVSAGAYAAFLLDGEFTGSAYDGYLRDGDPTGEKVELESAAYDFSSDICKFQYGVQAGAEYKIYKHLAVFADLKWGLNGIFPSDYSSVTFALYPIYGTLGFTYLF